MCNCEEIERIKNRIAQYEDEIADADFDIKYFGFNYPKEVIRDRTDRIKRLREHLKTLKPCEQECDFQIQKKQQEEAAKQMLEEWREVRNAIAVLGVFKECTIKRLEALEANVKELNDMNYDPVE